MADDLRLVECHPILVSKSAVRNGTAHLGLKESPDLSETRLRRGVPLLTCAAVLLLAACAAPTPSPAASTPPSSASTPLPTSTVLPGSAAPSASVPIASTAPTVTTGFAFAADDVVAYYKSLGYTCTAQQPSTKATGFFLRTCEEVDDAGRTRVIGIVTDPGGGLANSFASVQGKDPGIFLAPIDALEPLAAFLGATLGEDQGSALLSWLAGHLGDAYAETASGALKVATYTESVTDPSRLYVEIANKAYLDAPATAIP